MNRFSLDLNSQLVTTTTFSPFTTLSCPPVFPLRSRPISRLTTHSPLQPSRPWRLKLYTQTSCHLRSAEKRHGYRPANDSHRVLHASSPMTIMMGTAAPVLPESAGGNHPIAASRPCHTPTRQQFRLGTSTHHQSTSRWRLQVIKRHMTLKPRLIAMQVRVFSLSNASSHSVRVVDFTCAPHLSLAHHEPVTSNLTPFHTLIVLTPPSHPCLLPIQLPQPQSVVDSANPSSPLHSMLLSSELQLA